MSKCPSGCTCDRDDKNGPCSLKVAGTTTTTATGAAIGAAVGGPVGLVIGTALGFIAGAGSKWCGGCDDD